MMKTYMYTYIFMRENNVFHHSFTVPLVPNDHVGWEGGFKKPIENCLPHYCFVTLNYALVLSESLLISKKSLTIVRSIKQLQKNLHFLFSTMCILKNFSRGVRVP